MSAASTDSRLNFSPVTPFRSRSLRMPGRRLMLGLTERHVRPPEPTSTSLLRGESPVSGLPRTANVLDRLNSPLTRFHD